MVQIRSNCINIRWNPPKNCPQKHEWTFGTAKFACEWSYHWSEPSQECWKWNVLVKALMFIQRSQRNFEKPGSNHLCWEIKKRNYLELEEPAWSRFMVSQRSAQNGQTIPLFRGQISINFNFIKSSSIVNCDPIRSYLFKENIRLRIHLYIYIGTLMVVPKNWGLPKSPVCCFNTERWFLSWCDPKDFLENYLKQMI